jgi:hypothetical protein
MIIFDTENLLGDEPLVVLVAISNQLLDPNSLAIGILVATALDLINDVR